MQSMGICPLDDMNAADHAMVSHFYFEQSEVLIYLQFR